MSGKLNAEIEDCVRNNVTWQCLPVHLKEVSVGGLCEQFGKICFSHCFYYEFSCILLFMGNLYECITLYLIRLPMFLFISY